MMIWRCRYPQCERSLYNTHRNNIKREQNATTIIFATVKINRKTEQHNKPIVTNNLNGWRCRCGIAIDIVIIVMYMANWMKTKGEQENENQACAHFCYSLFLSLTFIWVENILATATFSPNALIQSPDFTHMCTGCAHIHHAYAPAHTSTAHTHINIRNLYDSFSISPCEWSWYACKSITKILKPIKIAIIVDHNKTTLCTLWAYRIYISYFPI